MIRFDNISKSYQGQLVLKNISFEVSRGDIFGIVGKSGAGKSTLLRTVNGLCRPDSGDVSVDGQVISKFSDQSLRRFRQKIGMIFQNFNLLGQKNVDENIALPMKIAGFRPSEISERTGELIRLTGLAGKEKSYPSMLSGGQKQRVAIARALGPGPGVLLCDEATSALDAETTASVLDLLKELNSRLGVTILLITHETEVIKRICDQVALLWNGQILEIQQAKDFFKCPKSAKGREFVSQINRLSQIV